MYLFSKASGVTFLIRIIDILVKERSAYILPIDLHYKFVFSG